METNILSLSNRFDPLREIEKALTQCLLSIRSSVASQSNPSPPLPDLQPLAENTTRSAIVDPRAILPRSPGANSLRPQAFEKDRAINNPSPLPHSKAPYKTALSKPRATPVWRVKHGNLTQLSCGAKIRQTFESIKASSSPGHPFCFKCGSPGHEISSCRNATLCYLCNGFGHIARYCSAVTSFPPSPKPKPPSACPPPLHSQLHFPLLSQLPSTPIGDMNRNLALQLPIPRFYATPESETLEQHFRQSFFLNDEAGWGPDRVSDALFHHHRQYDNWRVRVFSENRYLIEAPHANWLDNVLEIGFLRLDNTDFPITPWDPGYLEGLKLLSIWVKVRGVPQHIWNWINFEVLFQPYGAIVYEIAPETDGLAEFRNARIRLGMCDPPTSSS